jgi:hypothetical protein
MSAQIGRPRRMQTDAMADDVDVDGIEWPSESPAESMRRAQLEDLIEAAFGDDADGPERIPGYGELAVEGAAGVLHLWWKGTAPDHVQAALSAAPAGITIDLREAPYTLSELLQAMDRIWDESKPSGLAPEVEAIAPLLHTTAPARGAAGINIRFTPDPEGLPPLPLRVL